MVANGAISEITTDWSLSFIFQHCLYRVCVWISDELKTKPNILIRIVIQTAHKSESASVCPSQRNRLYAEPPTHLTVATGKGQRVHAECRKIGSLTSSVEKVSTLLLLLLLYLPLHYWEVAVSSSYASLTLRTYFFYFFHAARSVSLFYLMLLLW